MVDGVLLGQKFSDNKILQYLYDDNGTKYGFIYDGTTYFYDLNLQGDVIGIIDTSGNTVVSYTYDPWGKVLSVTGTLASTIGQINPIRYRGYYYDSETEPYYLQSRYYSPELMRFISQDDPVLSNNQGEPLGSNLYAYCLNNPVKNVDPQGNAPFLGWGLQLEGSFMGVSGGIELIWFKNIAKSIYGTRNLPCVYFYGALSYNFRGSNIWNIKTLIKYVKDAALKTFGSSKKAAWKIGGSISICAFLVYGTINTPQKYKGPFISSDATIFHIKAYYAQSPKGDVKCYGIGVSSSKFGFSPLSYSCYTMVPSSIIISISNWFFSLFGRVKTIASLV